MNITDVKCRIKEADGTERELSLKENEGNICFSRKAIDECVLYTLNTKDLNSTDPESAFKLLFETDIRPVRMTAMYMLNDWWTRPLFINSFTEIPERTQILFIQTETTCYCVLPMIGKQYKTQLIPGTENGMQFNMFSGIDSITDFSEPVFILSEDSSPSKAIHKAMKAMIEAKNLPVKKTRYIPEMLEYLGWCSWDAFYQQVNGKGLEEKAEELSEKHIPVKWFLIDDGWLSTEGKKLKAFEPDEIKFPEGFLPVLQRIKANSTVENFGVWHAVCGYWEGISDDNNLGCDEVLYRTKDGNLYPSPYIGEAFYRKWYEYLKKEGISFTKVDGQSTVANFFKNNISAPQAAEGIADAIEKASDVMDYNVINCMGMAMETITARKLTGISRNSDDFVPSRGAAGFKEHLLQNAYNSLYHNDIYLCDWDMFWTSEPDAVEHALLRAASGGPVYFSDPVGKTKEDIIMPLIYEDGKLLKLMRSLMPADECIFTDPLKEGVLKLHNYGMLAGYNTGTVAVFNLTDQTQEYTLSADDIPELDQTVDYVVYDWFEKKVVSDYKKTSDPSEYKWYIFSPKGKHAAYFGRTDKYTGFTAIEEWKEYDGYDIISLHEEGAVCWYADCQVVKAEADDMDCTHLLSEKDGLYFLDLERNNKPVKITIKWK